MTLVRCPVHDIPYNDDHPRGCPACAREKEGDDQGTAIQALAKASKTLRRARNAPSPDTPDSDTEPRRPRDRWHWRAVAAWLRRPVPMTAGIVIAVLMFWLVLTSGPQFIEGRVPPDLGDETRPLPVQVNVPIGVAFAVLGVRQPRPHPTDPRLARYAYGSDLAIDALNGVVYAVTIALPTWSWRGLRVGLPERNAEGALVLLGTARDAAAPTTGVPTLVGGYHVYPSVERLPRRTRAVAVRPPNGCFDVLVDVQPRVIGLLADGSARFAVVGRADAAPQWVVTRIRIVSRAVPDADSQTVAC